MKNSTKFAATFLAGSAFLATGLLLAPNMGSKLRSRFLRKRSEYKELLTDNLNNLVATISHPFESIQEETMRLSKKANAKAKRLKKVV
jgi:gas vesicle protein